MANSLDGVKSAKGERFWPLKVPLPECHNAGMGGTAPICIKIDIPGAQPTKDCRRFIQFYDAEKQ
jgi:hypothetical protein